MVGTLIRRPLPPVSDFIRTLLDDADATAALATLGITSGTYTPTLTNTTNVAASTAFVTSYLRVGSIVVVFSVVQIDATTAAGTATQLGMSLPIASNFAASGDLAGIAGTNSTGSPMRILADTTNDRAQFNYACEDASNVLISFIFAYRVI